MNGGAAGPYDAFGDNRTSFRELVNGKCQSFVGGRCRKLETHRRYGSIVRGQKILWRYHEYCLLRPVAVSGRSTPPLDGAGNKVGPYSHFGRSI